jgi:hypothetical protein
VKKFWNGKGPGEVLYEHTPGTPSVVLTDWSADGRLLTFFAGETLYVLPLDGSRKPIELERTEFTSVGGRFSPDGRLLAYLSDRSGRYEIYVRPLIGLDGRLVVDATSWQVSDEGALGMISWQQQGKAIEYLAATGSLMFVEVANSAGAQATLRRLFQPPRQSFGGPYAALDNPAQAKITSDDGQRLVFALPIGRTP